jgi:hypothetical protein
MLKKQRIYNIFLLLFTLLLLLSCIFIFLQNRYRIDDYSVEIVTRNEKIVQSLNKDQTIPVAGLTGKVIVQIQNNKVRVIDSNCPDKICIKAGFISKPGPMIICAPNHVVIRIISRRIKPLTTY